MSDAESAGGRGASAPFSERIAAWVCLGFALWTLCAHAVVAAGGSLATLVALYGATGVAAVFVGRRVGGSPAIDPAPLPAATRDAPGAVRVALAVLAAGAAVWAIVRDDAVTTWWLLVLGLGAAAVAHLAREAPQGSPAPRSRRAEWGLLLLAIACAAYALGIHRPDADDAFFVNMAVAAVDHPELPLLARDTLHGRFDLPIQLPTYRAHSYELAVGAVSLLTGLSALHVFHLGAAALGAMLACASHGLLFRRLAPGAWLAATTAWAVLVAVAGETHHWYGNFAFVRMWQGKAFFLFVFLPLVSAYACASRSAATAGRGGSSRRRRSPRWAARRTRSGARPSRRSRPSPVRCRGTGPGCAASPGEPSPPATSWWSACCCGTERPRACRR